MTGLHRLLCKLFQGDGRDLRDFVRRGPEGEQLVNELLSAPVSLSALAQSWIDRCIARGLVDAGFFLRLIMTFPRRALEIHAIAQQWRVDVDTPPAESRRGRTLALVPGAIVLALSVAWGGAHVCNAALPIALTLPASEPEHSCVPMGLAPYLPPPRPSTPWVPSGDDRTPIISASSRPPAKEQPISLFRRAGTESKGLAGCWQAFNKSSWKLRDFAFHLKTDESLRRVVVKTTDATVGGVVSDCFERELAAILSRKRIRKLDPVTIKLAEIDPNQ